MSSQKKVLVVDLDGSLYKVNTFHYYIKFLLLFCIKTFDVVLFSKIVTAMILRVLNINSHAKMKYSILKGIRLKSKIDNKKFVDTLASKKREIPILNNTSFHLKILATAAPSCYSSIIAKNENFDTCIGTDFPNTTFNNSFENCKEIKKHNTFKYLTSIGVKKIDVFITDHIDDLPLILSSKHNIVISPSNKLEKKLKQNQISFEITE